jgi:nitrogen fixation protein
MIRLSDNLEINKPAPVDDRLGVFVSTASALTSVPEDRRYIGLTVIVDDGTGAVEYWFKDGVTDADLEAKSTGGGGGGVPYTGATQNVDLGTYNLTADQLALNVNPTGTLAVGMTEWNDTIGSSQTLLKGGSVTLKNGVDLVARVVNKVNPNTTLTKANYQVVKVTGAQGQRLAVDLARANNDLNSADTLGVVTETIAPNQEGFILTVGQLEGVNTTGSLQGETWADGDVLYLSPTTAGRMTNVKPNGSTGHIVVLGYVEYAHANNGKIYVKIMNGWELDELHNVYIDPATLANNDVLVYDSTAELWQNTKPWLIGAPYTIYNSSAAAVVSNATPTSIDFTINTSQLRNGSTIILQGYMSRASGSGTATFSWTANSNANIASQSFTSGTQYGIQFYWTAKYISGSDSLRFFRTPTTSFVNNTTNATTFFDVAASGGVFTINFRATVTAGSMTGATENLTSTIIY